MPYEVIQAAADHIGRTGKLEHEMREGVEHLVAGQHQARVIFSEGKHYVELSYVPIIGHRLVVIHLDMNGELLKGKDQRWATIITDHGLGAQPLADGFELSETMREVATAALEEYQRRLLSDP